MCGHTANISCCDSPLNVKCEEPCVRRTCQHPCEKKCWEECGTCKVLVEQSLRCGHRITMECYWERENAIFPVKRNLPARVHGTKTEENSSEKCVIQCQVAALKTLRCGHEVIYFIKRLILFIFLLKFSFLYF